MRTKHILSGLVMATMFMTSCYREQDVITPASNPVGGKGGNNQIRITPKHFEQTIDTAWIFVKYDSKTLPLNWKFDDSMQVKPQNGTYQAVFDSLKRGNYYFYARGYSFDKMDTVTGGATVQVVDTLNRTYDVYLDVRTFNGK